MAKVSIIIPVYNVEKYLKTCLDSVINQTLSDIEIICVNDGSTDNSLEILKEYEKKDNRIKIITKENGGLSSARNAGLEHVTGDFCYFLDSDDYVEPTLFEYALNIFDNFDVDFFCFGAEAFKDGEIIQSLDGLNNYLKVKRDGVFNLNFEIKSSINIHVWNKIFKTSIIKNYGIKFIDKLLYEDIYFTWYYLLVSQKAYFDTEIYYHYRVRANSIMEVVSAGKNLEKALDHLNNFRCLYNDLAIKDKDIFNQNYYNLIHLLDMYVGRTKELTPAKDKYKVEKLKEQYLYELENLHKKSTKTTFWESVFSMKYSEDARHKVFNICGLRVKILAKTSKKTERVLVHLHVYYNNQIDFFIKRLKNIDGCDWDLYVTYVNENKKVFDKIRKFKKDTVFIKVENCGYDIYPFLQVLRTVNLNKYDYILKLHTKNYQAKEPYWHGKGWHWRNVLTNSVLGSKKQFKKCLNVLNSHKVGELGSCETLVYMGNSAPEDTSMYEDVCKSLDVPTTKGHFIAGSMFMVKAKLMEVIRDLPYQHDDFSKSEHTGDKATLAHVIERLLGVLVEKQGYEIVGVK